MAGKLLTKSAPFLKKATAVLSGGNISAGLSPGFEQQSSLGSGFSSSSASCVDFEVPNQSSAFNTLRASCSTPRNLFRGSLLSPLRSHGRRFPDSLGFAMSCESVRYFHDQSGTGNGSDSQSSKGDIPKVGIISSMFEDDKRGEETLKVKSTEEEEKKEKGKDGKEEEKTENSFLRSQRYAKWMLIGTFAFGTPLLIYEFGPPKQDHEGNFIADEYADNPAPLAYIKRTLGELSLMKKDIVEPSSQKLLPDPLQHPYYQPPYTLVLELFDVLLHPVYDQVHGWRFKKRPGIEYLLENAGPPLYEIIIFTRENGMVANSLVDSMDKKGYIMYRLFRDSARFKSGFTMGHITKGEIPKLDPYYQKDLTYLNRDLRRVVVVDTEKRATELQPSNGITLKPWDGSNTDTELYDLAAFLHTLATNEVADVRPVLEHYQKYEDPLAAFKLAQARMQVEQQKLMKDMQENKEWPAIRNSDGGGFAVLSNFFRSKK